MVAREIVLVLRWKICIDQNFQCSGAPNSIPSSVRHSLEPAVTYIRNSCQQKTCDYNSSCRFAIATSNATAKKFTNNYCAGKNSKHSRVCFINVFQVGARPSGAKASGF